MAQPIGTGGSHGGATGAGNLPPPTVGGWLHGVGQAITPTPSINRLFLNLGAAGRVSRLRTRETWDYISKVRSTV